MREEGSRKENQAWECKQACRRHKVGSWEEPVHTGLSGQCRSLITFSVQWEEAVSPPFDTLGTPLTTWGDRSARTQGQEQGSPSWIIRLVPSAAWEERQVGQSGVGEWGGEDGIGAEGPSRPHETLAWDSQCHGKLEGVRLDTGLSRHWRAEPPWCWFTRSERSHAVA